MKRIINTDNIKDVNTTIILEIENLKKHQNQLKMDIEEIKNYYIGKDAEIIMNDYREKCETLNIIINNYENYSRYIGNISESYDESVKKAVEQLEKQNIDMIGNKFIDENSI